MKLFLLCLLMFMTLLRAEVISESKLEELSQHATWLKLLHFKDGKSTIVDEHFFLDDEGHLSSKKELNATIYAYFDALKKTEKQPLCRYPARYYWLSTYVKLKNYAQVSRQCTELNKWSLLENTDSISVIFVSGYLGNPASAFGHSFIKVNQSENIDDNLFDTSISYGALLPPKYTMPEYIVNGIFGGYTAAYSDKYYYNQDITYSNQEYRDMWEYRLDLSDAQKKLFLLHAWELMGKKFQYFFFNRNCGYKVSEFLELVYNHKIIDRARFWYAPIETFYKLKELESTGNLLIEKVKYIPSKQQQLYAHYKGLDEGEKKIVQKLIENNLTVIPKEFEPLSKNKKANALDFVLAYKKYKEPKSLHRALLLSRLRFPIRTDKINRPKNKVDITEYNKPNYLALMLEKEGLNLHWSPFALEKDAYNDLEGDELVVFDTKLKLTKENIELSKFDLIRIQKLQTQELPFEEENLFSWNLHIGMHKLEERDYFAKAGVGFAWQLFDNTKVFSMVDVALHSIKGRYRSTPKLGLFNNFNKLRLFTTLGYEKNFMNGHVQKVINMNGQYKMNHDFSFVLDYGFNKTENLELGIQWFY
ncbi:MAG: Unknown protein [uncultured Sulfurovum sp.]|uniref:Uncharacterized protein n=1 Tax=uncultured Sulfurovum sp. TaxID=269237 RepID=A0A6S6TT10_9BACT|nr:MAG: Unknown protein [uncultured Sulfurovum sp.]